jgi:hypothetical protein
MSRAIFLPGLLQEWPPAFYRDLYRRATSMASSKAHHATGWAAGVIAAALAARHGWQGPFHVWAWLAFVAGVAGATAPDWLEVAWWSRHKRLWITHRTATHWGLGWLAALFVSWHTMPHHPAAAVAFGFACGGVMHLLADWPNPLGVPWILGRHSLKLWNSGHCDLIVVAASWVGAWFVVSHVWMPGAAPLTLLRQLL